MTRTDLTDNLRQPAERDTLVSVVVPTYNRAHILPAAVTSVLRQSWTDVEVVIVDDGSRDATRQVVERLIAADNRVRYVHQPNGGVSAARNTALAHCRGEMIAFLDSDDAWHPGKLSLQVGILQALTDVGMVWSDMNAVDEHGRLVCPNYLRKMYKGYRRLTQGNLFAESARIGDLLPDDSSVVTDARVAWGRIYSNMVCGNLVHTSTVLMRRERAAQVGPFDESMRTGGEDYKFHLTTTRLGAVAFVDAATIDYRIGAADQITNAKNQVSFASAFLQTLEAQIRDHRVELAMSEKEVSRIRAEAHDWLASALIESGERRRAATHAMEAIRRRPGTPTAWKTLVKSVLPRSAVELVRAARNLRSGSTSATM
ncbi:MAG TPA: glycosyltransferase [Caulifigura sp.]|nr:glycosyltransferase [Caulifigura sp.]